ncbi:MAG: YraN family protein [Flavobacteriales bacterium]
MAYHNELGKIGEQLATDFLIKKGYSILERNYFFDKAEIDIIAQKTSETLVVVEVKTRNSDFFGDPQEFVTPAKIKRLVKATNEYVIQNNLDVEVRFDIIAILKNKKQEKIEHFINAFYHF